LWIEWRIFRQEKKIHIGGAQITLYLKELLKTATNGIEFETQSGINMVKQIKELYAYVSLEDTPPSDEQTTQYITSDEQEISFPSSLLSKCCEVLFNPQLVGMDQTISLQAQLLSAIDTTPENMRSVIIKNIILCGGSAQLPGLSERLVKELSLEGVNIVFPNDEDQRSIAGNLPWMGGAKISLNNSCQWFLKNSSPTSNKT